MTSVRRTVAKKKIGLKIASDPLNSFKVPKKASTESVLESVALDSADYLDEILPQITQSFRFPQLAKYLRVDEAWLVHNRVLEQSFTAARKRLQKCSLLMSSVEANLCTGFCVFSDWAKVKVVASDGLSPGNVPDTWLGQPDLGVTVNQCADIAVARSQRRLQRKLPRDQPLQLYLIVVRWVKSKAYLVAPGAEESEERLEPQPGYACHVSTWSRIDPLDPAKVSLERAYQMSQVYLYEFDEDLELRAKPEHVMPYAVVKCHWELSTEVASKLESLNPATGSILVVSPKPVRSLQSSALRPALLPTPSLSLFSGPRSLLSSSDSVISQAPTGRTIESSNLVQLSGRDLKSMPWTKPTRSIRRSLTSGSLPISSAHGDEKTSDEKTTHFTNPLILKSRKLQSTSEIIARLGERMVLSSSTGAISGGMLTTVVKQTPYNLLGVTLLCWGHPKPNFSLFLELYTYRREKLALFDCLFQPCLQISRLISHAALHYELAGLTPWSTKPPDPSGPPVLVSIPRDQEWCLPRLNNTTASSLQCDPSPFAGYRGNYFRLTLHDTSGQRTEMSQFCQTLSDKALAGVVHLSCDESSVLLLFPDCQFSRSIINRSQSLSPFRSSSNLLLHSFPPSEGLETNYLHAILLTPYSLDQYPYHQTNCLRFQALNKEKVDTCAFIHPTPVPVPTDIVLNQRKAVTTHLTDAKLKMPLDALLSTLPDGGKDLLGTALIALLASRRGSEDLDHHRGQLVARVDSTNTPLAALCNPQSDPRLNRHRPMDTQSIASALLSTVAKNPELFKRSTPNMEANATEDVRVSSSPSLPAPTEEPDKNESPPKEVAVEAEVPCSPPSAPASPVAQPSEDDPSKQPTQPKEIPLSASTPSKLCKKNLVNEVTSTSQDMEVELGERSGHELTQTSDMEVTNSSCDYGDSPLKFRLNPPTYRSSLRESRSSFAFPTQVEQLVMDRRSVFESFGVKNLCKNEISSQTSSAVPFDSALGVKIQPQTHSVTTAPILSDNVNSCSRFDIPEPGEGGRVTYVRHSRESDRQGNSLKSPHPTGPSIPTSESTTQSPKEPSKNPTTIYEDGSKMLWEQQQGSNHIECRDSDLRKKDHSPSQNSHTYNSCDETGRAVHPGPLIVLEDISKTHPFFTKSTNALTESEEGEVLDDDMEDADESFERGRSFMAPSLGEPIGDGSYSCISSDISSATHTLEDEWTISSNEISFSTQCSRSPKPSPKRHSFRGSRSYHSRDRRTSPNGSAPYEPDLAPVTRYANTRNIPRSYHSTGSNSSLDDKHKTRSSREPFESSLHQSEPVVEDKDMRIIASNSRSFKPSLLPLPSDVRESRTNSIPLSESVISGVSPHASECRVPNDSLVRPQSIGSRDVDYRRLSSGGHPPSSRRSRDYSNSTSSLASESRRCSSAISTSSTEYLPRYSVYHPKVDGLDSLRSDSVFKGNTQPYDLHSPESSSRPIETIIQTLEQRPVTKHRNIPSLFDPLSIEEPPTKRKSFLRELPVPPRLPVNPHGLLPTSDPSVPPSFVRPPLLGGLMFPPGNPANVWSMAHLFTPPNTQLHPPPW